MLKNRIIIWLSVWLFSYQFCFAQNKIITKTEITKLYNEATLLMKNQKWEKSLIKSRIALHYAILLKDNDLIARNYNIIAANFDDLAEPEKAFFYYKQGLEYAEKTKNNELKNWLHNNLGNIYCFNKQEYKKGIYHYKTSLKYSIEEKDSVQIVFTNLNLAWAYFDINDFKSGLPYLKFINKYNAKFGDSSTIVALNMLNGMYYSAINDFEKANNFFKKAIKLGNKGTEKSDLSFSHHEYSKFLFKQGDYKNAYKNLELFNSITREINNEDIKRKSKVAGINLEIDEFKRKIDKIETESQTRKLILLKEQGKNQKMIFIIAIVFLILFVLFYFSSQNAKLIQKNKLNRIRTKIQENLINASINGQEEERKKIASFLHDNISALLSSAGMHLSIFKTKNKILSEELLKTKALIEEAHDQVRDLSHQLMPTLLDRFGLFFGLSDLCEKNSSSKLHFNYSSTIPEDTRFNKEFEMKIYFIITEVLNNIIKHSKANTATIVINQTANFLQIEINDNGIGFNSEGFDAIKGFGLHQIKARIRNMNGFFSIESKNQFGTKINFEIPINAIN